MSFHWFKSFNLKSCLLGQLFAFIASAFLTNNIFKNSTIFHKHRTFLNSRRIRMTYRHNMEKVYNIKDTIRNYYLLNTELSLEGGPTNNGEKFVEKVAIEKEILSYFGLPLSSKYIKLIWNTFEVMENVNEAIPILLEELKEKAQEFELNKKKSMATKLQEGADNQIEAFDLFPDLQIDLNLYTLFIYNEMLVKKKEPIEKIIQELEKAKGKECLTDIYQLSQLSKNYEESDFYQSLKKRKLIYLDNFVDWCKLRDNQK